MYLRNRFLNDTHKCIFNFMNEPVVPPKKTYEIIDNLFCLLNSITKTKTIGVSQFILDGGGRERGRDLVIKNYKVEMNAH